MQVASVTAGGIGAVGVGIGGTGVLTASQDPSLTLTLSSAVSAYSVSPRTASKMTFIFLCVGKVCVTAP